MSRDLPSEGSFDTTPVLLRNDDLARATSGNWIAEIDEQTAPGPRAVRISVEDGRLRLRELIEPNKVLPIKPRDIIRGSETCLRLLLEAMDLPKSGRHPEIIATRNFCTIQFLDIASVPRPRTKDIPQAPLLRAAGCADDAPLLLLHDRNPSRVEFSVPSQAHRLREIAGEISLVADVALAFRENLAEKIHLC